MNNYLRHGYDVGNNNNNTKEKVLSVQSLTGATLTSVDIPTPLAPSFGQPLYLDGYIIWAIKNGDIYIQSKDTTINPITIKPSTLVNQTKVQLDCVQGPDNFFEGPTISSMYIDETKNLYTIYNGIVMKFSNILTTPQLVWQSDRFFDLCINIVYSALNVYKTYILVCTNGGEDAGNRQGSITFIDKATGSIKGKWVSNAAQECLAGLEQWAPWIGPSENYPACEDDAFSFPVVYETWWGYGGATIWGQGGPTIYGGYAYIATGNADNNNVQAPLMTVFSSHIPVVEYGGIANAICKIDLEMLLYKFSHHLPYQEKRREQSNVAIWYNLKAVGDYDFGSTPNVIKVSPSLTVVTAQNKSGVLVILNANTMKPIASYLFGPPGGGSHFINMGAYDSVSRMFYITSYFGIDLTSSVIDTATGVDKDGFTHDHMGYHQKKSDYINYLTANNVPQDINLQFVNVPKTYYYDAPTPTTGIGEVAVSGIIATKFNPTGTLNFQWQTQLYDDETTYTQDNSDQLRTEFGRYMSAPIIAGNVVYCTTYSKNSPTQSNAWALDKTTGKVIQNLSLMYTKSGVQYPLPIIGQGLMVCDGQIVVSSFAARRIRIFKIAPVSNYIAESSPNFIITLILLFILYLLIKKWVS